MAHLELSNFSSNPAMENISTAQLWQWLNSDWTCFFRKTELFYEFSQYQGGIHFIYFPGIFQSHFGKQC